MRNPFLRPPRTTAPAPQPLTGAANANFRIAPLPYGAPRALSAAATRINLTESSDVQQLRRRAMTMSWQTEAWEYTDAIGEIAYAFGLVANLVSRCRIYAASPVDEFDPPAPINDVPDLPPGMADACTRAMKRLTSAHGGMAGLLRDAAFNLCVAGEAYLSQVPARHGSDLPESWDIRSTDEIRVGPDGTVLLVPRRDLMQSEMIKLPPTAFLGRIWRPHPRRSDEPTSSMIGVLDPCLSEGTMIYTARGPVPIETVRPGERVYAEKDGRLVIAEVSAAQRTGIKSVFELRLHGGRQIRATENHKFLTLSFDHPGRGRARAYALEYKRVDALVPGDQVVAFSHINDPEIPPVSTLLDGTAITPDVGWLLGVYAGDGFRDQNSIHVAVFNARRAARLADVARETWGLKAHYSYDGNKVSFHSRTLSHAIGSTELGTTAPFKRVPAEIWVAGPKVWEEFLLGFTETDGTKASGFDGHRLYSTSKQMLREMQTLALCLGYRTSQVMLQMDERTNVPIGGRITPWTRKLWSVEVYRSGKRLGHSLIQNKPVLRKMLPDSQLCLSTIKSITPAGTADVYDLTVPETSNFIAEGIVSHNCNELLLINRTFRATARSRLNAGMLYMPDGLSVARSTATDLSADPAPDPGDTVNVDTGYGEGAPEDTFEDELTDAMITPIADEESASAVVPLLVRGPTELGAAIKQFKFERSFDPALADRNDRLLERILQGIDAPKEVVTGLAHIRFANAIAVDDNLFRAHIEPLVLLLVDALTVIYLRPSLRAEGFSREDAARAVIWYDPSEIVARPDRSQAANDGYDRNELSGKAWRHAHGFSEADAPTDEEVILRAIIARGQLSPELTESLMRHMAPELLKTVTDQEAAASDDPLPPEVAKALGPPVPATAARPGPNPGDAGAGRPPQSSPRPLPDTEAPPSPNGSLPPR